MKSSPSILILLVACAACLTSTSAWTCDVKTRRGSLQMPYKKYENPKVVHNVANGRACLLRKCAPSADCETAIYDTQRKTCTLYNRSVSDARGTSGKKEAWYCKGGVKGRSSGGSSGGGSARTTTVQKANNSYGNIAGDGGSVPTSGGNGGSAKLVKTGRKLSQGRLAFKAMCSKLVTTRLDPIVNPGTFSGHIHNVFGNQHFGPTVSMNDLAGNAKTTCNFPEDKSMYWSPALYGKLPGGKFYLIPSFAAAYYQTTGKDADLYALPRNMRMLVGNAKASGPGLGLAPSTKYGGGDRISDTPNWLCHTNAGLDNDAYGRFPGTKTRKGKDCTMWQARLYYPDCWNGKDLDSGNHLSHMRYSNGNKCPGSHPYSVPQIKFETIFRLNPYAKKLGRKPKTSDFVLSNGDTTGASFHGDVITGWEENQMAKMLKSCTNSRGNGCTLQKNMKRSVDDGSLSLRQKMPQESTDQPQTGYVRLA